MPKYPWSFITLLCAVLLMSCLFSPDGEWDNSLAVNNESKDYIFVQITSMTRGSAVEYRFGIEANDWSALALPGVDRWKGIINAEGGLLMKAYLNSYYEAAADSLGKVEPLKTWSIQSWNSVDSVNGHYVYP